MAFASVNLGSAGDNQQATRVTLRLGEKSGTTTLAMERVEGTQVAPLTESS